MATHNRTRATDAQFAEAWRGNRPYLVNLAFGMLGDIGAAEDAVQEAFARLADADYPAIEDARGWLIVVTSRICLDQINSARSRRERSHEASTLDWLAEPHAPAHSVDPADRVTLDDEVRAALLVVLERLTPAERVVFVLHDIFQTPFESIAVTVGRPAATCRQLARRARTKIHQEQTRVAADVDPTEHRLVADRFIQACAVGDVDALIPLLHPDVWGDADLGPADRRTGVSNRGWKTVSRNLLRWFGHATLVGNPLSAQPEVFAFVDRELYGIIRLTVVDERITRIHVVVNPANAAAIATRLAPRAARSAQ